MKGNSKHRLMQEIRWEDLKTRKATHELLLYFKIVNNLCPSYLVDLLHLQVNETEQITPYERHQTDLFSLATLSVLKDPFPLYYYLVE